MPNLVRTALKKFLARPVSLLTLAAQRQLEADYDNLGKAQSIDVPTLLKPLQEWPGIAETLAGLMERAPSAPPMPGALNQGDRRAIYGLVRALKPANVLEIGTYIGSSTIHVGAALRANATEGRGGSLTTVDVIDVNGPQAPWMRCGMKRSPKQMVDELGIGDRVRFYTSDSIAFLRGCKDHFDFVFLDGSHAAKDVYNEIALTQRCLNAGALILLHDFFPDGKPLWPGLTPLPGPWLAYARLRREGAPIRAIPLGNLPWPTKAGTSVTSLALLGAT